MITTLPTTKDVRDLYLDLMGRDINVRAIDAWSPAAGELICVAEFVDDQTHLQAIGILDLPLAVYSGACIGLMPPGGAKDMITEKDPSPMLLTNLYEVLNILSSVFNVPANPHVRISQMHEPGAVLPAEVSRLASQPTPRVDVELSIGGYGAGRLALIAA